MALNNHEFLVLERDNRGIGVDDPASNSVIGSKRVYKINSTGATNIAGLALPDDGNLTNAGFNGNSAQRDLDQPTMRNGVEVGPVPDGFVLIPGVLHAYKASATDLAGYERPRRTPK